MNRVLKFLLYFMVTYLFCLCKYVFFSLYIYMKYDDVYWDCGAWNDALHFSIPLFLGIVLSNSVHKWFSKK